MILGYHKIAPTTPTVWWISVDRFYEHMHALKSRNVVTLDEYDSSNPDHVVITFDGIYENVYKYAFPILKYFGYPFELFVVADYIGAENTFDQKVEPPAMFASMASLQEMSESRGRIQWHTRTHRRLTELSEDGALSELTVPKTLSSQWGAPHFSWFAFPHGEINERYNHIIKNNFRGALACDGGDVTDQYNLPRKLVFQQDFFHKGTVAAIVANYNYGHFLREAVNSLELQTSAPDEILIIDDCSTDSSALVLDELEAKGYRVVRNEKNLGIVKNFAKAVSLTKSDYIFFLGADNRLRSDFIMKSRAELDKGDDIAIAYTDITLFGPLSRTLAQKADAQPVGYSKSENWSVYKWTFPEPKGQALDNFKNSNFVHGSSMYRRSFYEKIGGVSGKFGSGGPQPFLPHVAKRGAPRPYR